LTSSSELQNASVRFGDFVADLEAGELRKAGSNTRLTGQPFQVLVLLLDHPGRLVTREEFHRRLWPGDTFVDFEHGLNAAVNRLREALGDSAENPKFIETLPRRGYRFIASVLSPPTREGPSRSQPLRVPWGLVGITVIALLAIGGSFLLVYSRRRPVPIHSIAVLPFQNLSGDPTQDYFADGITDELITDLAKIGSTRVVSRTTTMHYKGTNESLPRIAQELGVDIVVVGSVTSSPNRVRIRAQLVRGRTDENIWANSYERNLADVVVLQGEMARDIADQIHVKLTQPEKVRLAATHSVSAAAYQDYLMGHQYRETNPGNAVAYFEKAIQEQSDYAAAYAEMAEAYISLGQPWGAGIPPREALSQAKMAANRALELDESVGEAHLALARVLVLHDWSWQQAEKEYRRALELSPQSDRAHFYFAEYLQVMGRNDEGIAQSREAIALDPLDPSALGELGFHFYTARRYEEAIQAFQDALKVEPDLLSSHLGLAWAYGMKKMYTDAVAEAREAVNSSRRNVVSLTTLGCILAESGQKAEARKLLEEIELTATRRYVSPYLIASVQTAMGETQQAFESLTRAYEQRDMWMIYLAVDPGMDPLRNDSRFVTLSRGIGLFTLTHQETPIGQSVFLARGFLAQQ